MAIRRRAPRRARRLGRVPEQKTHEVPRGNRREEFARLRGGRGAGGDPGAERVALKRVEVRAARVGEARAVAHETQTRAKQRGIAREPVVSEAALLRRRRGSIVSSEAPRTGGALEVHALVVVPPARENVALVVPPGRRGRAPAGPRGGSRTARPRTGAARQARGAPQRHLHRRARRPHVQNRAPPPVEVFVSPEPSVRRDRLARVAADEPFRRHGERRRVRRPVVHRGFSRGFVPPPRRAAPTPTPPGVREPPAGAPARAEARAQEGVRVRRRARARRERTRGEGQRRERLRGRVRRADDARGDGVRRRARRRFSRRRRRQRTMRGEGARGGGRSAGGRQGRSSSGDEARRGRRVGGEGRGRVVRRRRREMIRRVRRRGRRVGGPSRSAGASPPGSGPVPRGEKSAAADAAPSGGLRAGEARRGGGGATPTPPGATPSPATSMTSSSASSRRAAAASGCRPGASSNSSSSDSDSLAERSMPYLLKWNTRNVHVRVASSHPRNSGDAAASVDAKEGAEEEEEGGSDADAERGASESPSSSRDPVGSTREGGRATPTRVMTAGRLRPTPRGGLRRAASGASYTAAVARARRTTPEATRSIAPTSRRSIAPSHAMDPTPARPTTKPSTEDNASAPRARYAAWSSSAVGRCVGEAGGGARGQGVDGGARRRGGSFRFEREGGAPCSIPRRTRTGRGRRPPRRTRDADRPPSRTPARTRARASRAPYPRRAVGAARARMTRGGRWREL